MAARAVVTMVSFVLGLSACGGGGPGSPAKLPSYQMMLWVHRLQRGNGAPAGEVFNIETQLGHAKRLWPYGGQPGTVTGSGCLIFPILGHTDLALWKNWPSRLVWGKNVDASDVRLGDRFYADSINAPSQRDSPNTRFNWDRLLADRNNFIATNSDYSHGQLGSVGSGVHVYYTEQIVFKDFGTVDFAEGFAGALRGGAPNIIVVTDETLNPVNGLITVAHELGHVMGIRHDNPPHEVGMLMYIHSDVSPTLPERLSGGITAATTIEPGDDTDCGRARRVGWNQKLFTRRIPP